MSTITEITSSFFIAIFPTYVSNAIDNSMRHVN
jgi:hypothetical protein